MLRKGQINKNLCNERKSEYQAVNPTIMLKNIKKHVLLFQTIINYRSINSFYLFILQWSVRLPDSEQI